LVEAPGQTEQIVFQTRELLDFRFQLSDSQVGEIDEENEQDQKQVLHGGLLL
jgi:hypothetical protein